MYRVLFVDDEPLTLLGLRKTFNWDVMGFEIIAATTNPVEALDIIYKEKPDVVFTDIRMPEITGLDLIRKVRDQGMDTEFVVISGFAEFAYAQEALRLGAFDYCLKPVRIDKENQLLARLFERLENKKSQKDTDIFELLMAIKDNGVEFLKNMGLYCTMPYYQVAVVLSEDMKNRVSDIPFKNGSYQLKLRLGPSKYFYLFNVEKDVSKGLPGNQSFMNFSVGISCLDMSPDVLPKLFSEADALAHSEFIFEQKSLYTYKDKNANAVNALCEKIFRCIDEKDEKQLRNVMDEVGENFKRLSLSMEDVTYFWNQITAFVTRKNNSHIKIDGFEFMDYEDVFIKFENFKSMCEYIFDALRPFILMKMNKSTVIMKISRN